MSLTTNPDGEPAGRADFFGIVVSALVCIYLLYALLRGEKF